MAVDQQAQTIALRFKDAGVNEVVGVGGTGAMTWPRALQDNQSTYKPPWIATNVTALSSYITSAKGENPYLDNVMASTPLSSAYQVWMDPAMQKCAAIVRKAYPSDAIAAGQSEQSSGCVEWFEYDICRGGGRLSGPGDLAKIADAAGKNLTVASFTKACYQLRNVTFPGTGGPVSFGPNQAYAKARRTSLSITLGPAVGACWWLTTWRFWDPSQAGATSGPSGRAPRASRLFGTWSRRQRARHLWMNRATNVSGGERSSERKHHDRPAN